MSGQNLFFLRIATKTMIRGGVAQKIMRMLCFLSLALVLATGALWAQADNYEGMKGTETPTFQNSSDTGKCFVFGQYVVKTDQIDADGENVAVFKRTASTSGKTACRTAGKSILYVKDADNNSFFGLFGNFLFVDNGTSAESRGLEVYNLTSRKSIITRSYSDDAKLVDGRFVMFDSPSERKGSLATCKQAAKWKREGGGVRWVQGKRLDLETLKETNVGTLRCAYME